MTEMKGVAGTKTPVEKNGQERKDGAAAKKREQKRGREEEISTGDRHQRLNALEPDT